MAKQLRKLFCMGCGAKRMHIFGANYTVRADTSAPGSPSTTKYCIVECRQCGEVSALRQMTQTPYENDSPSASDRLNGNDPVSGEQTFSLRGTRQQPLWFADLTDGHLRRILAGLYQSLENTDMALFGARMAVDRLMTLTLGVQNSFEEGLQAWQDQEKISGHERRILEPLMNVGNVSHVSKPVDDESHTTSLLDTLEKLVCRLFILPASGKCPTGSIRRGSGTIRVLKTPDGRIVDFSVGFSAHQGAELAGEDLPRRRRTSQTATK